MSGLVTYLIFVFLILIPLGLFIDSKYGIKSVQLDELETLWQLPDLKTFIFISCFCISWMLLNIILTIFKNIFSEKYEELYIFLCGDGSGPDGEQIVSTLILKGMICIVLAILVSGYTLRYFYTFNCC
tara:strand:+ start:129 stop:512 length:384 start_codon:yes stop_codon:yes gene_type:complete